MKAGGNCDLPPGDPERCVVPTLGAIGHPGRHHFRVGTRCCHQFHGEVMSSGVDVDVNARARCRFASSVLSDGINKMEKQVMRGMQLHLNMMNDLQQNNISHVLDTYWYM